MMVSRRNASAIAARALGRNHVGPSRKVLRQSLSTLERKTEGEKTGNVGARGTG